MTEKWPTKVVTTTDGREISFLEFGDLTGFPIFYCHGLPGSGLEVQPYHQAALSRGVHLIAIDRPGIADSTPQPDRSIHDWTDDLRLIATNLAVTKFSIFGWSGGCAYTLTAAAQLRQRVMAIGLIAPQSPYRPRANRIEKILSRPINTAAKWLGSHTKTGINALNASYQLADFPPTQSRDPHIYEEVFSRSLIRALKPGTAGTFTDTDLIMEDWTDELLLSSQLLAKAVPPIPTFLWQGGRDKQVSLSSTEALSKRIPNSELRVKPKASHLQVFLDNPQEVLDALVPSKLSDSVHDSDR